MANESVNLAKVAEDGKNLVKTVNEVTKSFNDTAKAIKTITDLVSAWGAASKKVSEYADAMNACSAMGSVLISGLKLQELAVGAVTQQIGFAQAATAAWNIVLKAVTAHPIMAIAGAAAAVVGALIILNRKQDDTRIKSEELTKSLEEEKEAWTNLQDSQKKNVQSSVEGISHVSDMVDELNNLIDTEGQVIGNKDRVRYLVEEINRVLPESVRIQEDERVAIEQTTEALKEQIRTREVQAALDAAASSHPEIKRQIEEGLAKISLLTEEKARLEEERNTYLAKVATAGPNSSQGYSSMAATLAKEIEALEEHIREESSLLDERFYSLDAHAALTKALAEGNKEEMDQLYLALVNGLKSANHSTKEELEAQNRYYEGLLESMLAEFGDCATGAQKELKDDLETIIAFTNEQLRIKTNEMGESIPEGVAGGMEKKKGLLHKAAEECSKAIIWAMQKKLEVNSPSKLMAREVGLPIVEGIVTGVGEGSAAMIPVMEKSVQTLVDAAAEQVKSVSKVYSAVASLSDDAIRTARKKGNSYKEIGSLYVGQMTEGINRKRDSAVEEMRKLINSQIEAAEKENREAERRLEEQNTKSAKAELAQLKEKNAEVEKELKEWGSKHIAEYTEAVRQSAADSVSHISEAIGVIADEMQNRYDEIIRNKEALEKKLADFGELYLIDDSTNEMSLANIQDQIDAMKRYEDALTQLKEKGVSEEFLSQVTAMGMEEGSRFAETLLSTGAEEFNAYVEAWEEKQALAKEVASRFYRDELDALEQEFVDQLETALAGVPGEVENIGRYTMQGFVAGMESQRGAITATARSIADQVKRILESAFEINSPSKWAKRVIGTGIVEGMGLGMTEGMDDLFVQMKSTVDLEAGKLTSQFASQAGYTAARESREQKVQTVFQNNTVEKTPVVQFKGELAALARVMTPHIVTEIKRQGSSYVSKEGFAGV